MLERYFVFPHTVDRILAGWIGEPIERYVEHLTEGGYAERTIRWREQESRRGDGEGEEDEEPTDALNDGYFGAEPSRRGEKSAG